MVEIIKIEQKSTKKRFHLIFIEKIKKINIKPHFN